MSCNYKLTLFKCELIFLGQITLKL